MDSVEAMNTAYPISAVRLVHPLPDPKTGQVCDVIIRELKPIGITHDKPTRRVSFGRFVPGLNVRIPWPEVAPKPREEHPIDTKRIDLEVRTFVPTLLRPPIPEAVLDELRGRYSKFRTRHTPEYVAKKEAEEAEKQARKKSAKEMLLPVQEYNRKMREQRRALGQPELTNEMLAKIGEVIARNKQRRAQGVSVAADNVQKAVAQLSIEDGAAKTPKDQPRASV